MDWLMRSLGVLEAAKSARSTARTLDRQKATISCQAGALCGTIVFQKRARSRLALFAGSPRGWGWAVEAAIDH
jgi:hypothetical protein